MLELCMDRLKDKVALITGGARGLGASIAKHFFNEGAKIILCDINIDQANEKAHELNGTAYYMDVSNSENVKEVFTKVKSCLLYTSPSPRDVEESRMPSSA